MTTSHALYRFYNADSDLLYIGITNNPTVRWRGHRNTKDWWHEIATITLQTFPDRTNTLKAEREAIIAEHPQYNVVYNVTEPAITKWGPTPRPGDFGLFEPGTVHAFGHTSRRGLTAVIATVISSNQTAVTIAHDGVEETFRYERLLSHRSLGPENDIASLERFVTEWEG